MTLHGKKCQIGLLEVAFLGHVVSGAGVKSDNAKVKAVEEWPIPNCKINTAIPGAGLMLQVICVKAR